MSPRVRGFHDWVIQQLNNPIQVLSPYTSFPPLPATRLGPAGLLGLGSILWTKFDVGCHILLTNDHMQR